MSVGGVLKVETSVCAYAYEVRTFYAALLHFFGIHSR